MRYGKILFLLAAVALLSDGLQAKDKLVERSGKRPGWVMNSSSGWFSVFAQSDDLNDARDRCLSDIRQYIVSSIAANITSTEVSTSESHNTNGIEDIYSAYSSELKTAAAKMPFITDISLSNALDTYWEKYRRKSDRTYYYIYYVQYPFTRLERNRLIRDFKEYDSRMYGTLKEVEEAYSTLTDVSEIDKGISALAPLLEYFFDDVRKSEAESVMRLYRSAYSKISLVPESKEPGRFVYRLVLDGRTVTCSRPPALRSETAVSLELRPSGSSYELTYDCSLCLPTDDNYVLISYSFPGKTLRYRHQFDVSGLNERIVPTGIIGIDVVIDTDSTVTADVSFYLRSGIDSQFEISDVHFTLPGITDFSRTDKSVYEGEGRHLLQFRQSLSRIPEAGRGMVTGEMDVKSDNMDRTITFTLPYNLTIHNKNNN